MEDTGRCAKQMDSSYQHQASQSHSHPSKGETPHITTRRLGDLLKVYLSDLSRKASHRPDLVMKMWPQVVGSQIANMTKANRFENKTLFISVKNSTLLSILSRPVDKIRLVNELKAAIPGIEIENIVFRFG